MWYVLMVKKNIATYALDVILDKTLRVDPDKLRRLRKAKKLTGLQLAELVGVSNNTISKVENGSQNAGRKLAQRLADALGVSIQELMSSEIAEPSSDPREKFLLDTFQMLDDVGRADLLALASRLLDKQHHADKSG
jgi:transcriptional regulator with XRE-family HTH domain